MAIEILSLIPFGFFKSTQHSNSAHLSRLCPFNQPIQKPTPTYTCNNITMGTTSVRRNLFNNHLSKRAVSTVPPMQGSSSNTSNVQSSRSGSSSETNSTSLDLTTGSTDNGEIVVKDKNGGYKLDIPVLAPVIGGEDGDEIEGFDESQNGGGSGATVVSTGETEIGGREKESMWNGNELLLRQKRECVYVYTRTNAWLRNRGQLDRNDVPQSE